MDQDKKMAQIENYEVGDLAPVILPQGPLSHANLSPADYIVLAGEWFNVDVANGDVRADTMRTYLTKLGKWLAWCYDSGVNPSSPTSLNVNHYRQFLVNERLSTDYIQSLLSVVRRFYAGAVLRGHIENNPAAAVKAPRNRSAKDEKLVHLTAGEAELLFRSLPPTGESLKALRDRVIIALMMLEGLRRVEIHRANVSDIEDTENGLRILVHGKGKDGYIYPREDVIALLNEYMGKRGGVESDKAGDPLFVSLSKAGKPRGRISRIGLSKLIKLLYSKAAIDRDRLACHALRHTCGAQLYQATRDLKVVQETLRHASIAMAAKYSHIQDRGKARYTQAIPIKPE